MFLSKLSLLAAKAGQPELEHTIDRQTVRENLYEFLKDDLVYFLQKALSGRQLCDGFPDLSPLQKEIIQILKELGVYVYYPVGKDFNRTSIMERWYLSLFKTGKILTLPKVINYFNIYRNRLYSLAETMPFEFSDVRRLTRKMLTSNDYEISFEEIYNSELALRQEILFALLRQISPNDRLAYLVGKEIITNLSDDFIKVLHSEFAGELEKNLSEQKSATIEIIKEKATMDSEIRLAGKQQNKNLQQTLPEGDERIHFSVWYSPLMTVGGDYYRVIRLDDNEYALFLADISGHGIGAAMHINTLRLGFDENLHYKDKPEKLLRKLSDYLYGKIGDNFVTAIYVHINLKRKIIRYCNAGHPKAFLYELVDGQKGARFLRPTGKVLGLFQKSHFRDTEISISPKERLVLYTDGISESFNKSKQMLGERGLLRALTGSNNLSPEATIEKVKNFLLTFQKEMVVEDDRCLILTDLFANIN